MIVRFISLFLVVLAWALLTETRWISPLILPSPSSIVDLLTDSQVIKNLITDSLITAGRLVFGFVFAVAVGVPCGIVVGANRILYGLTSSIVDFCRSIPIAALFPLFLLFFGFGETSKFATTAWSSGLIVFVNTVLGVQSINRNRQQMMHVLGATKAQILLKATLPDALPQIFSGLRIAVSIALIVVVMTEMYFGANGGLGYRIYNASLLYQVPTMYLYILAAGILGFVVNLLFERLDLIVIHWRGYA